MDYRKMDPVDGGTIPAGEETGAATAHDVGLGGGLGAVGGAAIGMLAGGPIGAVVGALVGGAVGAGAIDQEDQEDHHGGDHHGHDDAQAAPPADVDPGTTAPRDLT